MDYYAIGQRIRKIRKARQLSQEDLAEMVGISVTHMSHIENGSTKLSLPVLVDLAAALDVSVNELLAGQSSQCLSAGYEQVKELLNGCSEKQLRIITEVIKSTKAALDKYGV